MAHMHPAAGTALRVLGKILMFPVLATLLLLAPIVTVVCGLLFVGGIFASIIYEVSAVGPRFPFLFVMGLSLGLGLFLVLYHMLIAFLVSD